MAERHSGVARTREAARLWRTMKGTPRSLFLSAANRAAGWWIGHAANAMRRGQAAWLAAATKAATPKRKLRKRKPR
jgi:hypothetical protein